MSYQMSKLFEYLYLGLAIACLIYMVVNYEALFPDKIIYILIFMGLFSFLFAFRRTSRIRAEKAQAMPPSEEGEQES